MKTLIATLSLFALLTSVAQAETYRFEPNPKYVVLTFESRMEVEDILGTSHGITGTADLDKGTFQLTIPVKSLKTGIDLRDEHMRNDMWLHEAKHAEIRFEGSKIDFTNDKEAKVHGQFTLRGKTVPLTTTVRYRRIPEAQAQKLGLGDGNWVRARAEFEVKLSDHGIQIPKMAAAKVSDIWTVKVSLFGKAQ